MMPAKKPSLIVSLLSHKDKGEDGMGPPHETEEEGGGGDLSDAVFDALQDGDRAAFKTALHACIEDYLSEDEESEKPEMPETPKEEYK